MDKKESKKTIILGVSGCIAAYKSIEILRGLQKAGVEVKVVMTKSACQFVGPITFEALSQNSVLIDLFDFKSSPIGHISYAKEADLLLIAPCTANVCAKLANGIADDALSACALACTCPVLIAPAMNVNMYNNPASVKNRQTLKSYGMQILEAEEGYLACGDVGKGKLPEVDYIVQSALDALYANQKKDLTGKNIMITAGPTIEDLDPVRFISNRSSGKTGYAIARAAVARGANVTLISGPVNIKEPNGLNLIKVDSALQMYQQSQSAFKNADIAIFCAAVSDMRPAQYVADKIKKNNKDYDFTKIDLVENPDIICNLAKNKEHRIVVGFAAESQNVIENAKQKCINKNANFIVANDISSKSIGFATDHNKVSFVYANKVIDFSEMQKAEIANHILDHALQELSPIE